MASFLLASEGLSPQPDKEADRIDAVMTARILEFFIYAQSS
jgi:hypothetical protein